jgi:hypothetical protein
LLRNRHRSTKTSRFSFLGEIFHSYDTQSPSSTTAQTREGSWLFRAFIKRNHHTTKTSTQQKKKDEAKKISIHIISPAAQRRQTPKEGRYGHRISTNPVGERFCVAAYVSPIYHSSIEPSP